MKMLRSAEVVIIGGGAIGCSVAYQLAKRGWKKIVLVEKRFLASGSTGRCVGSLRGIWTTEITSRLVLMSLEMMKQLDEDLKPKRNNEFIPMGRLIPLYSDRDIASFGGHLELAKKLGIETEMIGPQEANEICPALNTDGAEAVIFNFESTGGLANPFYTTLGLAERAAKMGVKMYFQTEVTGIETSGGNISAVVTNKGKIHTPLLVNATGPYAASIGEMLELDHPVRPQRHQIAITEKIKRFLNVYVLSVQTGTYLCQLPNGQVIMGCANPEGEPMGLNYNHGAGFLQRLVNQALVIVPELKEARIIRQWAGHAGISTDGGPILGPVNELSGYHLALGCGKGFQLSLAIGKLIAELLSDEELSLPIYQLRLNRLEEGHFLSSTGTAVEGHEKWQT